MSLPFALRGRAIGALALVAVMALATAGTAGASSVIVRSEVAGATFTNPCTAEPFTITGGTFQLITTTTADSAGGLHLALRGNAQGVVAEGQDSGDQYRLAGDFWSEQMIRDAAYPLTLTVVEVHHAVSSGSAPNLIVHVVRHLTIDATGAVTANVGAIRAECRG